MCIPPLLKLASRLHILDVPDKRKIHDAPIPRIGGIALVIAALVPIFLWIPLNQEMLLLISGIAVIFITGILDDVYDLNYKIKLVSQIIAASFAVFGAGISFGAIHVTSNFIVDGLALQILSVIFIVGVTNALNLSDGMDGLAAGVSLLSLSVISLLAIESDSDIALLICIALIGGIFGFLRFNTYPAKIFMGDTGSQFLGFMLAVLSLMIVESNTLAYSALLPFLIVGLPVVDTLSVIIIRLLNKKSPFSPDQNHIHHRLLNSGYKQYTAVIILYVLQLFFVLCAYLFNALNDSRLLILYILISTCSIGVVWGLSYLNTSSIKHLEYWNKESRKTSIASSLRAFETTGVFNIVIIFLVVWFLVNIFFTNVVISVDIIYSALLLLIFPLWKLLQRSSSNLTWLERGIAYMIAVLVMYLEYQGQVVQTGGINIIMLLVLTSCVIIKMLRHKTSGFQGSPLDFLILLLALIGPLFIFVNTDQYLISILVLKSVLLFYCVEILFIVLRENTKYVRAFMVAHLGVIALLGIINFS